MPAQKQRRNIIGVEPPRTFVVPRREKNKTIIIIVCVIAALVMGFHAYEAIRDEVISADIKSLTGYEAGSPDNLIIREYLYNVNTKSMPADYEYDYGISGGVLFALCKNQNTVRSNLYFPDFNGKYPSQSEGERSFYARGQFMRADLDGLFSELTLVKYRDIYALMLTIDARSKVSHIAEYREVYHIEPNSENEDEILQSLLDWEDRTYADPDVLRLYDQNGAPVPSLSCSNGDYRVYYIRIGKADTSFAMSVEYNGEKCVLLTYKDIITFNVKAPQ